MAGVTTITALLERWRNGDPGALESLTPLVYEELHKLAHAAFRGERRNHTLQPTAVINEAYLQLADASVDWQDAAHFYALAARMMRRILVNHANARGAAKRGGSQVMLTYVESQIADTNEQSDDVLELDAAILALAEQDQRKADITELFYFGGLSYSQIGAALDVSEATVKRELRFARAWIRRLMEQGP